MMCGKLKNLPLLFGGMGFRENGFYYKARLPEAIWVKIWSRAGIPVFKRLGAGFLGRARWRAAERRLRHAIKRVLASGLSGIKIMGIV